MAQPHAGLDTCAACWSLLSVHPRLSHADWRLQPGVVPDSGLQDFFGLCTAVLKTNPYGNFDIILHRLKAGFSAPHHPTRTV